MHRGLLALLLADSNKVVSRDSLAEGLWDGQVPGTARTTLGAYISRLRRVLGPAAGARILTRSPGYLISVGDDEYDVLRAAELVRLAQSCSDFGSWERSVDLARDGLRLWRGEPFEDVPVTRLHQRDAPALEATRLRLAELDASAQLHAGRYDTAVCVLTKLVAEHPVREQFSVQLITALAHQGRRAEALTVYKRARASLRDQLGLDPGPELVQAHQDVLQGTGPWSAPAPQPGNGVDRPEFRAPRQTALAPRYLTVHGHYPDAMTDAPRDRARELFQEPSDSTVLARVERIPAIIRDSREDGHAQSPTSTAQADAKLARCAESLEPAQPSLELYTRFGQAGALYAVATAYERLGRSREALDHYLRTAELYLTVDDRYGQAMAYARVARVYRAMREDRPAREFRLAAQAIMDDLELPQDDPVRLELAVETAAAATRLG